MIEVTIRQTQALTENNARIPERVVQRYLREAFEQTPYDYDISIGYDAVSVSNQQSVCGENSSYNEWSNMVDNGVVDNIAKDSNVLITNARSGGCGEVGGNLCTAPGKAIDKDVGYQETGSGPMHTGIQHTMHEVGHNLGGNHDHNDKMDGNQHRGRAWNEHFTIFWIPIPFYYEWHRTPNVAGTGVVNDCGDEIPDKKTPSTTIREHHYSDCAVEKFEIE